MPSPSSKHKLQNATKFEVKLQNRLQNNLKITLKILKSYYKSGKEKKNNCIHNLVSSSCMAMRRYFDKWRLNKRLIIHEIKNQHVEHLFIAAFQKHQIFYKHIIGGN